MKSNAVLVVLDDSGDGQSGLKGQIPLYTVFTIDDLSLPQLKDLAIGRVPMAKPRFAASFQVQALKRRVG